jgi:hypothetical protein
MSEKKDTTIAAPKKVVKKVVKKVEKKTVKNAAPTKKSAVKKKAVSQKKTAEKTAEKTAAQALVVDPGMQSLVEEMNGQRKSRDKQIASLIEEVRDGFSALSSRSNKQGEEHQKEMTGLYQSLQSTFGKIKDDSDENVGLNLNLFKSLSDSMMNDHEQTLKEINGQAKLQDKKIEHMSKMLEQRTGRNRMIAIPGVIIAIIGIFYMFYVVTIMEGAMSNMSANMHLMQKDVGSMSGNMGTMTGGISSIDDNMEQLNGSMGHVSQDLNVLTRNVAPAMKGMRNVMPWSP